MQKQIIKVYGYLKPCKIEWLATLRRALAFLGDEADSVMNISGELLNISYEGVYFPLEELLDALSPLLTEKSEGKIDYIDMEGWRITRYRFENGFISSSESDLNNVLAYSGH